jgi:hypothetical protein
MTTGGRDQSAAAELEPLTWTMDTEQVEFIWTETREVFGNKLWFESMLDGPGLPEQWQDELAERSGQDIVDVLVEAVGDLRDPDPSLVFLGLHDACARYGVTLEIPPHPYHGDLLVRARGLVDMDASRPTYTQQVWPLGAECVANLWLQIETARVDARREVVSRQIAESLAACLGDERADELSLRCREQLSVAVHIAVNRLPSHADPSLVFAAMRDFFRDPDHGDVTLEFAPHPEHGDVLARARPLAP